MKRGTFANGVFVACEHTESCSCFYVPTDFGAMTAHQLGLTASTQREFEDAYKAAVKAKHPAVYSARRASSGGGGGRLTPAQRAAAFKHGSRSAAFKTGG